LIYFLSGTVLHLINNAPEIADKIKIRMETITGSIEPVMEAGDKIDEITAGADAQQAVTVREPGFMSLMAHTTPVALSQALISLTLAFFLVASGDMFYEKLVQAMPTLKDKRRALTIARDIENQLSTYLLTVTLINIAFGVVVGLTMWWLGLPHPELIAIAAFLLNYVPYIGTVGGMILTFVIGAVTYDDGLTALLPPLAYWFANSIEGQLITPILVGRRLRLNAVVVFTSFALWSWLWGIMGMFLATPLLLTLKVVSDRIDSLNTLGRFLGSRDPVSGVDRRIVLFMFGKKQKSQEKPDPSSGKTAEPDLPQGEEPEAA
jgi:predicted PurR-regulated permease PerM